MSDVRALTILNQQGDQSIVWTEDRDEEMERIIQKKMDEGMTFFIVEPRFFGLLSPKKTELENAADAKKFRALSIKDEDFAAFCGVDGADVVKTPGTKARSVRKVKDPKEAAKGQSVGIQPRQGG